VDAAAHSAHSPYAQRERSNLENKHNQLLAIGWMKHGPIGEHEVPGPQSALGQ